MYSCIQFVFQIGKYFLIDSGNYFASNLCFLYFAVGRSQPQNENGIPDHFAPILLNLAMRNMEIGWEKISENRTSVESTTAKENSIKFYGLENTKHCQILGPLTKHVMNAHMWPHNNMENLPLIDLVATDIDNPKNVLRLHSDIEHKFDRFLLTFVPSGNDFVLEVLDPSIRNITLKDTTVTFENINGRLLLFPSGNRPWRRILGTHSLLAHRKAREKGYLEEGQFTAAESSAQELMEFSLDKEAHERIKMVLRNSPY